MSNKETKVDVKADGINGAKVVVAGRSVVRNAPPNTTLPDSGGQAEVSVDAKNIVGGELIVAGGHVIDFTEKLVQPLDELTNLLKDGLKDHQDKIADLEEIVGDLKEQAAKPETERNVSKVERLLKNIGTYLGVATLAVTQVDKVQKLFEVVMKFFNPG